MTIKNSHRIFNTENPKHKQLFNILRILILLKFFSTLNITLLTPNHTIILYSTIIKL
jgi:hypothetical protein